MAIVAIAGPIANLVVAIGFAVVYRVLDLTGLEQGFLLDLVGLIVAFNVLLALFNLIPIPPLDGSNVLVAFLPLRQALQFQQYAPYGVFVLLLLIVLPNSPLGLLFDLAGAIARVLIGA